MGLQSWEVEGQVRHEGHHLTFLPRLTPQHHATKQPNDTPGFLHSHSLHAISLQQGVLVSIACAPSSPPETLLMDSRPLRMISCHLKPTYLCNHDVLASPTDTSVPITSPDHTLNHTNHHHASLTKHMDFPQWQLAGVTLIRIRTRHLSTAPAEGQVREARICRLGKDQKAEVGMVRWVPDAKNLLLEWVRGAEAQPCVRAHVCPPGDSAHKHAQNTTEGILTQKTSEPNHHKDKPTRTERRTQPAGARWQNLGKHSFGDP